MSCHLTMQAGMIISAMLQVSNFLSSNAGDVSLNFDGDPTSHL